MTVFVHIRGLHFGRDHKAPTDPLPDGVAGIGRAVVALSGDLIQRADKTQFARGRTFIDRIDAPVIAVPGQS